MPITFACSKCTQDLRIADDKAGRKVKCPSCGSVLVVPQSTGVAAAPKKPPVASRPKADEDNGQERRSAALKGGRKKVEEEDFEVAEDDAVVVEDEPPRPRKRPRRHEEDEDDVVVEDEPPSRRKPRRRDEELDEEDDDRPRRRRRDEVDEDEDDVDDEDSPRRRRFKKRKKAGSKKVLLLVLGLGGGGLVLLLGVGAALWFFVFSGGSGLGAEMKYLPDDCTSINSERIDQSRNSKFAQTVKKELPQFADDDKRGEFYGLATSDIDRITNANSGKENVTIITLKKAVSASDIKSKKTEYATDKKVGNYTIYTGQFNAFCVPESKIVVFASADTLEKILKRDKKPELSENMKKALSLVDFSKTGTSAAAGGSKRSSVGGPLDFFNPMDSGKSWSDLEATGSETRVGSDISSTAVYLFKDAKAAENGKKDIEEELNKAKNMFGGAIADMLKNTKISVSGSKVTITNTVKAEDVIKMIRDMKNKVPR